LRSPLPIEFNLSVRSSAYTDGNNPSVNIDELIDEMLRIKKKIGRFADVEVIAGIFYRRNHRGIQKSQLRTATRPVHRWTCRQNHRGIQKGSSVQWIDRFTDEKYRRNHRGIQNDSSVWWRVLFTVRIADGITDGIVRRQKLIYPLLLDPILPYFSFFFSFFFLISTLPICKQLGPLQKKKISLFSVQQVIFLKSSCHNIRVLIYLRIFISFFK